MGEEKGACGGVVELVAIVTLDALNGAAKLGRDIGEKVNQSRERLRLKA